MAFFQRHMKMRASGGLSNPLCWKRRNRRWLMAAARLELVVGDEVGVAPDRGRHLHVGLQALLFARGCVAGGRGC